MVDQYPAYSFFTSLLYLLSFHRSCVRPFSWKGGSNKSISNQWQGNPDAQIIPAELRFSSVTQLSPAQRIGFTSWLYCRSTPSPTYSPFVCVLRGPLHIRFGTRFSCSYIPSTADLLSNILKYLHGYFVEHHPPNLDLRSNGCHNEESYMTGPCTPFSIKGSFSISPDPGFLFGDIVDSPCLASVKDLKNRIDDLANPSFAKASMHLPLSLVPSFHFECRKPHFHHSPAHMESHHPFTVLDTLTLASLCARWIGS